MYEYLLQFYGYDYKFPIIIAGVITCTVVKSNHSVRFQD